MSHVPITEEGKAFGQALELQLAGRAQGSFGADVARCEGRSQPYSQQQVSIWVQGNEPNPRQAVAIEQALGVTPGTLTQLLGYLPVEAKPIRSVREAIEADPGLDELGRAAMSSTYQALVAKHLPARRSRP